MKSFLMAGLFFFGALFINSMDYRAYEWFPILLATLLGYAFGRISTLAKELQGLSEILKKSSEGQKTQQEPSVFKAHPDSDDNGLEESVATQAQADKDEVGISSENTSWNNETAQPLHTKNVIPDSTPKSVTQALADKTVSSHSESLGKNDDKRSAPAFVEPEQPVIISKITDLVSNYFTGGNLFVRVGILLLFFGVSFLLRYVSEEGLFPIEYRLMSVAASAIALLIFAWRLRFKKEAYSLLLQGAAIGILYLTIFAAFSLYHLIPAFPAFGILLIVSLLAAALAVLQNSQSLAFLGFSGGFLAPILASSGSNNYMGLFSYYVILNIALLVVAWFKAWRPLNLLGFFFTFIVGTAWGVSNYKPENFSTVEPFLILFFLMYVAIAVLFALRQPPKLKGYVDGSLLFGVPLSASALQYSLVMNTAYGVALSSFAFGAFYLVLAWGVWKRAGDSLRLLAEAFLAVGVIFTSLAIPFALDPTHTAAAWGLEGLGMLWLGSRQQRLSVRGFGLLLLFVAGLFVFARHDLQSDMAFVNSTFISSMIMAVASLLAAYILHKPYEGKQSWEKDLSPLLLVIGLGWLFGGFIHQIIQHFGKQWLSSNILILASVVSVGFTLVAKRTQPEWRHAWLVAIGLIVVMLPSSLSLFNGTASATVSTTMPASINSLVHPFVNAGWLAWPIAFIALYWILAQLDKQKKMLEFVTPLHTVAALLLIALITWEGAWLIAKWLPVYSAWNGVWLVTPALLGLWLFIKKTSWPFVQHRLSYLHYAGAFLAACLAFWSLFALASKGNSDVVMWLPILNPLDITLGIVLITLYHWWQASMGSQQNKDILSEYSRWILGAIGVLGFAWLNFSLFRVAHHFFDIPYRASALFDSALVHTSVSIMWALLGVLLTVFASHKQWRTLWLIGGGVLALVVVKLFVIDLSEVGKLARIISFLVVGVLLTSIGYFAPIPDAIDENTDNEEGNKGSDEGSVKESYSKPTESSHV